MNKEPSPDSSFITHHSSFSSGCPACGFPIRQLRAVALPTGGTQAETVCPSCGTRRPQIAALRSRLVAAWPGRGAWWKEMGR